MGGGRFCSLDQTHSECESSLVEIMSFRPRNQVKTKKKGLHSNLGLNSAGICGIYTCCEALFRLFNQRSNLDEGTLNLDGGTLNFDGGTRPPYNLSTASGSKRGSAVTVACYLLVIFIVSCFAQLLSTPTDIASYFVTSFLINVSP